MLLRDLRLLLSFVVGLLCGLCSWRLRRLLIWASLAVPVCISALLAWCTVYPRSPASYPYTDFLSSFRLMKPSWPFRAEWRSMTLEEVSTILCFLEYPLIIRAWQWQPDSMVAADREIFIWQTIINATAGITGYLAMWRVLNPRIWKAHAFARVLKAISLTLLVLGLALIIYGVWFLSTARSFGSQQELGIQLRTQAHIATIFGCILALVGISLYIVRKTEASRTCAKSSEAN